MISSAFSTNDAMVFKGTLGSSGTVASLPATHEAGWTYKVVNAGTYAGQTCEVGDLVICVADGTAASDSDWTAVQTNVDGAVTGPASSVNQQVAVFSGTSGKVIADSGYTIGKSVPSNAVFTDTTYSSQAAASGGTTVSLVTTGEKYTWDNKANAANPTFTGTITLGSTSMNETQLGDMLDVLAELQPAAGVSF